MLEKNVMGGIYWENELKQILTTFTFLIILAGFNSKLSAILTIVKELKNRNFHSYIHYIL